MTRPDHPLLTRALADALPSGDTRRHGVGPSLVQEMVAAIPPDIADRLERALSCCQRPMDASRTGLLCMEPEGSWIHQHEVGFEDEHKPHDGCHPFVPLVTP